MAISVVMDQGPVTLWVHPAFFVGFYPALGLPGALWPNPLRQAHSFLQLVATEKTCAR